MAPTHIAKMVRATPKRPPVILFGYDASAFTFKMQVTLKLKQIPYTYITVPSMMPRPLLKRLGIAYRKIPVLAIGRDFFIDTSLIIEALEQQFPPSMGFETIHPKSPGGRSYRAMMRGFASYWTDLPFYRVSVGTMPGAVWRSGFGRDRADLIGHKLDAEKLEQKIPQNLSGMDMHLSMFEPLFKGESGQVTWAFETQIPSLADIAIFFMLDWAKRLSSGKDLANLTGSEVPEGSAGEGIGTVFNKTRYPYLWQWFNNMHDYLDNLPNVETKIEGTNTARVESILAELRDLELPSPVALLETPGEQLVDLDESNGLHHGSRVSVTPDNTGRNQPVFGIITALTPEEIVLLVGEVRVHFPRVGFVVKPTAEQAKL